MSANIKAYSERRSERITHPKLKILNSRRVRLLEVNAMVENKIADILREMLNDQYPKEYKDCRVRNMDGPNMVAPTLGWWNWPCEKSPIGVCVYDDIWDRAHDFCVFCLSPEERK